MACNSICSYDDSYSTDYRWHTLQAYWHTSHFVAVNEDGCVHCIKTRFKQNGETMSHNITIDSGNPFAPPLNDWRSEGAPPNIHFHERPSHILVPTMHTHCCIPVVHGQFWVQFSQITPMQWTNQELCLYVFPKPVPPLELCSHVLDLLGWKVPSSWWMPTHSWTDMSGDINEGKEVSEWIWMVSSVTKVLDFLECVFVGTRTWRHSSKMRNSRWVLHDVGLKWNVRPL